MINVKSSTEESKSTERNYLNIKMNHCLIVCGKITFHYTTSPIFGADKQTKGSNFKQEDFHAPLKRGIFSPSHMPTSVDKLRRLMAPLAIDWQLIMEGNIIYSRPRTE